MIYPFYSPLTAILIGRASVWFWHQFNNTVASACSSGLMAVTSSHCISPLGTTTSLVGSFKRISSEWALFQFRMLTSTFNSRCWYIPFFSFLSPLSLSFKLWKEHLRYTLLINFLSAWYSDKYMHNVPQQSLEITHLQLKCYTQWTANPISHTTSNHHSNLYLWVCFRYFIQLESWIFFTPSRLVYST